MFYSREIHSLSDFQRRTREHMERLKATGRPELLTVNGKAALAVMDAEAFERLMEEVERARIAEVIRMGLESVDRDEPGIPARDALERIRSEVRERYRE